MASNAFCAALCLLGLGAFAAQVDPDSTHTRQFNNSCATGGDRSNLLLQQRANLEKHQLATVDGRTDEQNWYYRATEWGEPETGGWGGACTCPNGETYQVGDNLDSCASLACVGGVAGECEQQDRAERKGMKVRCDTPSPPPPPAGVHSREATRFLSWNVYYANDLVGRAWQIAEAIKEVDPEIVSIQEMWHEWDEILDEVNKRTPGQTWEFARGGETEKTWDGDILFRSDLWTLEESGMRGYGDRGVSWAALRRRSDGTGIIAAGTHPWCCTNDEPILRTVQDEILAVVREQRAKRPGYPAAVMGDMNANYYAASQYLMREGQRSAHNRDWNILPYTFKDSYAINGHDPDSSTGFGVKIDFVYFEQTPLQMGAVVDSKIWRDCNQAGSDHCAVSGDIVLSAGGGGGGGAPPTTTTTTTRPTSTSCASFGEWPNVDNGVTCGGCTALVLTEPYGGRCDRFCSSFGHTCVAAAEEQNENCQVKFTSRCDEEIAGTSDMLCTCEQFPSSATTTAATTPTTTATGGGFQPVDGGDGRACRGASSTDNSASYYQLTSATSLDDCKGICVATPGCVGVEYGQSRQRCEIWTREQGVGSSAAVPGYTCLSYQESGVAPTPRPLEFEPQDEGEGRACRGPGGVADNAPSYYSVRQAASLDVCKALCAASSSCTGIEWSDKYSRCEVWSSTIGSSKPVSGFTCLRAVEVSTA